MIQSPPPDELDGARVIAWMWSGEKPFGIIPVVDNDNPQVKFPDIEIYGIAVCQYENSNSFYRFYCDHDWEVQNDDPVNHFEDTMRVPDQFKNVEGKWVIK